MNLIRACLIATLLQAQQSETPTIRVNVNLIQLDVTVEDRQGKRMEGLTVDDFEVSRNGKRQPVKSVVWIAGKPPAAAGVVADAPAPNPGVVKPLRPTEVRRTIAVLIDDLSLSFESSYYARKALRDFVEKNVEPGDLVAVYRTSAGISVLQQFTTDKRQLLAMIESTRLRSLRGVDPLAPIQNNAAEDSSDPTIAEQAMQQRLRDEVFARQRQDILTAAVLSTARFLVQGLQDLPGRKSLILLSESIQMYDIPQSMVNSGMTASMMMSPGAQGGSRDRTIAAMRKLVDAANRNGVVIYTVDPRGLVYTGFSAADAPSANPRRMQGQMQQRQLEVSLSQDGMIALAEDTGGLSFRNTNDISGALAAALKDQEGYYLVAFQPDDETFEKTASGPKYQNLSVKVKRSGAKVRYRHGFYGIADDPDKKPVDPLNKALYSPFQAMEIPLKLTPIFLSGEGGKPVLRVLVHVDPSRLQFQDMPPKEGEENKEPWRQAIVDQLLVLYQQNGTVADQFSKSHTVSLRGKGFDRVMAAGLVQELQIPLPKPGYYQLRTAMMDRASKRTGSVTSFLEIPDLANRQIAMSDLVLSSDEFTERGVPDAGPGMRRFTPGAKLNYAAMIYNVKMPKNATKPNLETQVILYHNGKAVYTGTKKPFQPEGHKEGDPLTMAGTLTLGKSSSLGEYVLQIAVKDLEAPKKNQFFVRSIEFELRN